MSMLLPLLKYTVFCQFRYLLEWIAGLHDEPIFYNASSRTSEEILCLFDKFLMFGVSGICQEIPGMTQLNADDQALLMKLGYFDLWLVSV